METKSASIGTPELLFYSLLAIPYWLHFHAVTSDPTFSPSTTRRMFPG